MRIINLLLGSVILAWISITYFEYEKRGSKNLNKPSIDRTYLPISPSFAPDQIGLQLSTAFFLTADTKIASKLVYLSSPPVSELSDTLLRVNLSAAISKIAMENQNISFHTMDLFAPNAIPNNQPFIGKPQSQTTTSLAQFSMNIDPPIPVRLTNFDPKTMWSSKISDPSHLNTTAPVTPVAEFPKNKLTKMEPSSGLIPFERSLFDRIELQNLRSYLQSPQVISRPFVKGVEDAAETQIQKYKRMVVLAYSSIQKPTDKQLNFHNETIHNEKYIIAIGVFAQPSNLDKNIKKLLSNNLPVIASNLVTGNPRLRQLASGPYSDKTEALEVLNSIKALGYFDAYLQKANP